MASQRNGSRSYDVITPYVFWQWRQITRNAILGINFDVQIQYGSKAVEKQCWLCAIVDTFMIYLCHMFIYLLSNVQQGKLCSWL